MKHRMCLDAKCTFCGKDAMDYVLSGWICIDCLNALKGDGRMTKQEYLIFFEQQLAKMLEITKKKNADYTGTGDDPFANFVRVEMLGICSTEQGFLTRMFDKFSRIISFVQKGELQVKEESVEDTLLDLSIYSLLMLGYVVSKKRATRLEHRSEHQPKAHSP